MNKRWKESGMNVLMTHEEVFLNLSNSAKILLFKLAGAQCNKFSTRDQLLRCCCVTEKYVSSDSGYPDNKN